LVYCKSNEAISPGFEVEAEIKKTLNEIHTLHYPTLQFGLQVLLYQKEKRNYAF